MQKLKADAPRASLTWMDVKMPSPRLSQAKEESVSVTTFSKRLRGVPGTLFSRIMYLPYHVQLRIFCRYTPKHFWQIHGDRFWSKILLDIDFFLEWLPIHPAFGFRLARHLFRFNRFLECVRDHFFILLEHLCCFLDIFCLQCCLKRQFSLLLTECNDFVKLKFWNCRWKN